MAKEITLVIMLSNTVICNAQFYNCFLSGDTSGHSTWCGDNAKEEVDMKDPKLVMESAMKALEKHNKMVWDPLGWTIPPPSVQTAALTVPPLHTLAVPPIQTALGTPTVTVSDSLSLNSKAESGLLLPGSSTLLPFNAILYKDEANLSTTRPSFPFNGFLTTTISQYSTDPVAGFEGFAAKSMLVPLPSTLRPVLIPLTSSKGSAVEIPTDLPQPIANFDQEASLNAYSYVSENVQESSTQKELESSSRAVDDEFQEVSRPLELSSLPSSKVSKFILEHQGKISGLIKPRYSHNVSLLFMPYPKHKANISTEFILRRPLKPTRLTLNRSPEAFALQEEPVDEHHQKLASKLRAQPTVIQMNSHGQPMKLTRFNRMNSQN